MKLFYPSTCHLLLPVCYQQTLEKIHLYCDLNQAHHPSEPCVLTTRMKVDFCECLLMANRQQPGTGGWVKSFIYVTTALSRRTSNNVIFLCIHVYTFSKITLRTEICQVKYFFTSFRERRLNFQKPATMYLVHFSTSSNKTVCLSWHGDMLIESEHSQ